MGQSVLGEPLSIPAPGNAATESAFAHRDGVMYVEGVSLAVIAAAVGTPCYVYSASTIRARWQRLSIAFAGLPHRIHFAMKANSNQAVLQLLHELGAGLDIVSGGELFRARRAGFTGGDIVFSGVGKTAAELSQALEDSVMLINVESEAELLALNDIAGTRSLIAPVAIRVNPEVTVDTPHEYISTGQKGQKFGIPLDDVARIASLILELPNVQLLGLGMHLGSQIATVHPMRDALPRLLGLIDLVRQQGHTLRYIDVGGGLAVPYEGEAEADVDGYAEFVSTAVRSTDL
ncbi:MAG: alanine racemase [Gemmatimonadota bacterium]|nr:alanine racemase [Gemmatimonadota bacterium]